MSAKGFWLNKNQLLQVVLILIILYSISSVNVLVLALNILPYLPNAFLKPYSMIGFAAISFLLTVFMSIYHLYSMFRKRKRKTDILPEDKTTTSNLAEENK
jgi:predicted membrane protein